MEFQHNLEPSPTLIFLTLTPVVIGPSLLLLPPLVFLLLLFLCFHSLCLILSGSCESWMPNLCVCHITTLHSCSSAGGSSGSRSSDVEDSCPSVPSLGSLRVSSQVDVKSRDFQVAYTGFKSWLFSLLRQYCASYLIYGKLSFLFSKIRIKIGFFPQKSCLGLNDLV